ncbi:hypothetical protein GGI35DRAFT_312798 [Trichoderma velutinum]
MEATALMVRGDVSWIDRYFSDKRWMSCVPSYLQLNEIRRFGKIVGKEDRVPTILQTDEDEARQLDKMAEWGAWGVRFDAQPHNNDKLSGLIAPALKATSGSSNDWTEFKDLSAAVQE